MFRRRVRSALYIDFENVPLPPETIASWLAWLEDGVFDPKRQPRRFVQKRVYWNSNAEKHKETFQRHGFATILVGKYSGLKNGADIRMAMDLIETTYRRSEIDEYILLSGDSDFVPVLERLREKSKRTAMVATEHRPHIHTIYNQHADVLIPSRRLVEAAQYQRQPRTWAGRFLAARRFQKAAVRSNIDPTTPAAPQRRGRLPKPAIASVRAPEPPSRPPELGASMPIALAEARVLALVTAKPRNYVAQKRVLADLERVPGFKRTGTDAYLGFVTYKALMKEMARRNPMIKVVDQVGGGTGVIHVPDDAPSITTAVPVAVNGHALAPSLNGIRGNAVTAKPVTWRTSDESPHGNPDSDPMPAEAGEPPIALPAIGPPLPMPAGPHT